jgi:CheY-like chemotaxis protein
VNVDRTEYCTEHTVLVVDDEFLARLMIAEALNSAGYRIVEAATGERAVTVLHTQPNISAVVTDLRMPGRIDGAALAHAVRSEFSPLKIVMVSGQVPDDDVRNVLDGHFLKPLNCERMAALLDTLMPSTCPPAAQ